MSWLARLWNSLAALVRHLAPSAQGTTSDAQVDDALDGGHDDDGMDASGL
jgi:hypothetical protein